MTYGQILVVVMVVLEAQGDNMCVVSMIGDHYNDKWKTVPNNWPNMYPPLNSSVTKAEFEALRQEVLEMKQLLIKAVEYDKRTNQPHCEMEEKIATLKRIADLVGVDLEEVFGKR